MNNRLKSGRTRIALVLLTAFMMTSFMTMAVMTTACTFGIPEAVTVKTNPTLSFPLGSIGSALTDPDKGFLTQLETILDPKELEKTLPGQGGKPFPGQIYRYSDIKDNPNGKHTKPGGVQTYMITYPIQKMNQDLSQYMKTDIPSIDIEISSDMALATTLAVDYGGFPIPIPPPSGGGAGAPTIEIPFPDVMVTWMANIQLDKGTGIVFKDADPALKTALELCIPQFGVGSVLNAPKAYATGRTRAELLAAGFTADELDKIDIGYNDLAFICDTAPVQQLLDAATIPGTIVEGTDKIQVYAQLVGKIAAQTLKPTVAFEWEEVDMYPGVEGKGFAGVFEGFDLSSILDQLKFFGDVSLVEIPAYLYLSTEDNEHIINALEISLKYNVGGVVKDGKIEGGLSSSFVEITDKPDHDNVIDDDDGSFAASGLIDATLVKKFDLSVMLLPENEGAILDYDISFIPGASVRMKNGSTEISIKADMGMLLPMEFTFGNKDKDGNDISMTIEGDKYIPLSITQLDAFFATSEDGGEDGSKDAITEALGPNSSFVGYLQLTDIVNGLTGGMYLGVSEDSNNAAKFPWQVLPLVSRTETAGVDPAPLTMTKMAIPAIRILLKEDAVNTPGKAPFYIKEQEPKPVLDEAGNAVLDDDGKPLLKVQPELDFSIVVGGVLDLDKIITF